MLDPQNAKQLEDARRVIDDAKPNSCKKSLLNTTELTRKLVINILNVTSNFFESFNSSGGSHYSRITYGME